MKREKPTLTRTQAWGWHAMMVLAAFRYCCGQRTYIVSVCCDWLIDIWPFLDANTKSVIQRDLERDFELDDAARQIGESFKPLGWDCDRKDWERVRALWREKAKE
jgi:uncharacterized membrane protein